MCAIKRKRRRTRNSQKIGKELTASFPEIALEKDEGFAELLASIYEKYDARFVLVIDEWDYFLRTYPDEPEVFDHYINFLRSLFKNEAVRPAIELCYMTGIMPIKRYGSMSALNEFDEFTMIAPRNLAPFFGFSEEEVSKVLEQSKTKLALDELKEWFDGYRLDGVGKVYCPNSVVKACLSNICMDYFAGTAAITAITSGLKNHFICLEEESATLLAGGEVSIDPSSFSSDLSRLDSKDKGLTALVHAGFLRYESSTGHASIPNREVMLRFYPAVMSVGFEGGVSELLKKSRDLLQRTLEGDEEFVAATFDEFHVRLVSLFDKANEAALSVLASVAYADAARYCFPLKEPHLGKGRAGIAFLPLRARERPALVIELKVDEPGKVAVHQIQDRAYDEPLKRYFRDVLLVGISFDRSALKHTCKIEHFLKAS